MQPNEIENLELDLVIEAILRRYGHDFRHYARASLCRRLALFLSKSGYKKLSEVIPRLLYDKAFFEAMIRSISVTVTEMFRDPFVYQIIRKTVVDFLKTYPFIRIWQAGCATGEEVYSIAILLQEEGLYGRCQIYATDFNDDALETARKGIYPVSRIKEYTANYQKAGGRDSFSKYYHSQYDSVIMDQGLKKNIVFANHNLSSDSVFGEMHLIMCRNVLIYFDQTLQDRALGLFYDSLVYHGLLCLGAKESIKFSRYSDKFIEFAENAKIFQKW
jgi:chemotaxis protein methyltransferase CheR